MKTAKELWQYVSKMGLKPLPKTSVSQWADDYRMLSQGLSAEPGRWKTSRAPYQKDIMDAFTQPGINRVVVKSASQIGKALDVETPIMTITGWKRMGDLTINDQVFDENGNPVRILAVSEVWNNRPCYEIRFSDGAVIIADENHEWCVDTDKKQGIIIDTHTISQTYKSGNRNTYAIQIAKALDFRSNVRLLVDPYTLGAWLGDGNSMSAQITTHIKDVAIINKIEENGVRVNIRQKSTNVLNTQLEPLELDENICRRGHDMRVTGKNSVGRCAECARQSALKSKWKGVKDIKVDPVIKHWDTMRNKLVSLGVLGNKHIPVSYLEASIDDRWALLQGIMDTDGSCSAKGICEITQKNKQLANDIFDLVTSLGLKPTIHTKCAVATNGKAGNTSTVYRITFTAYADSPVFALKRKQDRLISRSIATRKSESKRRRIISVKRVENRETVCIEVDSPTHLFLAGRNLIPTHNSDIMNNVLGLYAHLDPCAVMMIQPTIELAQDYSKSRISPMIRDTKVLSQVFYETKSEDGAKTRDGKNTILSKLFPGGRLIMCGANSPAGLASRPVRVLLADEVDRFPDSAGTEGDPVDLAAKRMTTFWNRVMGLFSTPTNEGSSRIDVEYQTGTQEEWQHECPNCGEYHLIRHTEMECETEEHKDAKGRKIVIVSDVKWRCPDCGSTFSEDEMRKVSQKYISKNPAALHNGIRSFFVNGFTSPWLTWNDIMREWLEAKGDPTREKVVMNTRFGESYAQQGAFEDYQQFIRRREKYGADLPNGVLLLTCAVDTQDNRLEYEITGWGYGEECWGICKGVILGEPDNNATWDALDAVLDKIYHFKNGTGLKVARAFIDSGGHYTSKVYEYCEKNFSKQRFAIKGTAGTPGIPLNYKIGKASGSKIPLVMLGVDDGKQQVMNRLAIEEPGAKYFHFPLDEELLGTRGYDELYFKGIISEHKKKVKRKGVIHEIWEPTAGVRNEPLDLRVYNLACMNSIHPDWDRLAEVVKGGGHSTTTVTTPKKKQMRKRIQRASKAADI